MDPRRDIELNLLSIKFHLCLNLSGVGYFSRFQLFQFDFNFNEYV